MKKRIHAVAGITALTLVATFMVATILAEIVGERSAVLGVKTAILFALVVLIPSVMIAGGSGRSMAAGRRTSPLLRRKQRRATLIAVVGITVLVPCAVVLRSLAADGNFGTMFIAFQAVELAGGAVNLTLLSLNARDGRLLTAATRRRRRRALVASVPAE